MSHYIGYYGKIIVREEFYGIIENGLDLTGTTDPIFMLYENLEDIDRFDKGFGNLIWETWRFDKESGSWEFRVEYNESHQGYSLFNLRDYFIPYISKEIIDVFSFDEFGPRNKSITKFLREQMEHREETVREICEELNTFG
ncbi:hypothetical protein SAMN02910292_00039 [Lachnospiraceae bacterium XBB2008]|nr:hypothetical protein SAMN02910292_00039 [Lachnospiraceae bacterium XBB2008]